MESLDIRKTALVEWLKKERIHQPIVMKALPCAASFRRYFRVQLESRSYIVMDAPPELESSFRFAKISDALRKIGLHTPEIIAADFDQGFLLLTDFGEKTLLKILNEANATKYYKLALNELFVLQNCKGIAEVNLKNFDTQFMWQEWLWHQEWFLKMLLKFSDEEIIHLHDNIRKLISAIAHQPQVFVHRDYHSTNLMLLTNEQIGILDFQDAFLQGPITYDVVSLVRDCYIDWPEQLVEIWLRDYFQNLQRNGKIKQSVTWDEFIYWCDLMSIQRHLKTLFTFARKKMRDNQNFYLKYIPRTLRYLLASTKKYPETYSLYLFLKDQVVPNWQETVACVE